MWHITWRGTRFLLKWILDHWSGTKDMLAAEAVVEYLLCFDAKAIRVISEENRASATIDLVHDEADQEHKISCPTLVLWRVTGMGAEDDILEMWRSCAEDAEGFALDCGQFLPEEDPQRTAAELLRFLA